MVGLMGRPKKRKTSLVNYDPASKPFTEKVCYICNKKITKTQRFYGIGKKDGIELYRHQKCKTRDYKGEY